MEIRHILDGYNSKIRIIAKIENQEGIDNIDEILTVADGIVARGDMGVEIDFCLRSRPSRSILIDRAMSAGKICITATQMLDSMIVNPARPVPRSPTCQCHLRRHRRSSNRVPQVPVEALKAMATIAENRDSSF